MAAFVYLVHCLCEAKLLSVLKSYIYIVGDVLVTWPSKLTRNLTASKEEGRDYRVLSID